MKIRCDICNKVFKPGKNPITKLSNGVGFQFKDGSMINVCSVCLMYRKKEVMKFCEDLGYN